MKISKKDSVVDMFDTLAQSFLWSTNKTKEIRLAKAIKFNWCMVLSAERRMLSWSLPPKQHHSPSPFLRKLFCSTIYVQDLQEKNTCVDYETYAPQKWYVWRILILKLKETWTLTVPTGAFVCHRSHNPLHIYHKKHNFFRIVIHPSKNARDHV